MAFKIKNILKENTYIIASFFIPFIILIYVYAVQGIYPSGNKTILISDMEGQYIDFYSMLYDILKNGGSLLYIWQADMGINFIGILAYYLSSPFSLLIIFFEKKNLIDALYLITLIKIGSAGLTFSIYLKYLSGKNNITICIFSALYSLMSYSIVYSFNIMWLDGVVFLPLAILGVEKLIKENRFIFLYLSLALIFIANFYISYMVGVFSFLYFIVNYFSNYPFRPCDVFFKKLSTFLLTAVLAVGSAAFFLIPTFFALKNGPGVSDISQLDWNVNFKAFDLLSKLPFGSYDTLKDGLPNIYSGLLPLILASMFFINIKIELRERILNLLLSIFMISSFSLSILNLMWHGFDYPNWFPYRYSFLFSFLLISLSFRGLNELESMKSWITLLIYGLWLCVFFLLQKSTYPYLSGGAIKINIILLSIYSFLVFIMTKPSNNKEGILFILVLAVLFEASYSTYYLVSRLDGEFKYTSRERYVKSLVSLNSLVNKMKVKDKSFYRLDRTLGVKRSFNDSMNLNYNGISHFSSMLNGKLNSFVSGLGFITPVTMAVDYAGATLITDSVFGVKYIASDRVREFGYREVMREGNTVLYENLHVLPVGFMADRRIAGFIASCKNPFILQNDMLNLLLGNEGNEYIDYFKPLEVSLSKLSHVNLEIKGGMQEFKRIDNSNGAYVEFVINNSKGQQLYGFMQVQSYSDVDVYINGRFAERYMHFYNNTIIDFGYHEEGEKITIKLILNADSFTLLNAYLYGLDGKSFTGAVNKLRTGLLKEVTVTDTSVEGEIDVKEDGILFTSVPFDPGWKVFVDGRETRPVKIGGAFIGLELSKGNHEVLFSFRPQGLTVGMVISAASLGIVLICAFVIKEKRF